MNSVGYVNRNQIAAFGDFWYQNRPDYKNRQACFVSNLTYGLINVPDHRLVGEKAISNRSIDFTFKIDESWDSESVGKINIMVSHLCALEKGRELINTLFQLACENKFQIRFVPKKGNFYASLPELGGNQRIMNVGLDFNKIDPEKEFTHFSRLTFDGSHYNFTKMIYPPFIMLAHELSHIVHYIETYAALLQDYAEQDIPQMPSKREGGVREDPVLCQQWYDFAERVYTAKGYLDFFPKNGRDLSCGRYQILVYRAYAIEKFNKIMRDAGISEKEMHMLKFIFSEDFSEEEALNIFADGRFSDAIFLEAAREYRKRKLLPSELYDDKPIIRFGLFTFECLLGWNLSQEHLDLFGRIVNTICGKKL